MNVNFYTFSKRRNSTKQPTGTGTIIDCKLKEGTSVKNPKLTISGDVFGYDYAYIADFGRYYFVSDVISEAKGITTYVLEEDSLASNKTAIGNTVARIAFSATGYNINLADTRCAVSTKKLNYKKQVASSLSKTGCYVLTVFNNQSGASNGLGQSYILDAANIQTVRSWLGDNNVMQQAINYFLGNPLEAVFQCHWVPFPVSGPSDATSVGVIYIGNQPSNLLSAKTFSGTGIKGGNTQIDLPWRYNDFRDSEPYTSATLFLPGVGNIDINMSDWLNSNHINVEYEMEYGTGDLTYLLVDDGGFLIQSASCNVASLCPLAQFTSNMGGAVSSIGGVAGGLATAAAGIFSENAMLTISGAAGALTAGANTALAMNKRAASLKGGVGGRTNSLITDFIFTGYYMDTEDVTDANYIATKGRPVAQTHAISSHSGYVQCDNASVSIGGESWERDQINSYLNSGFFYE